MEASSIGFSHKSCGSAEVAEKELLHRCSNHSPDLIAAILTPRGGDPSSADDCPVGALATAFSGGVYGGVGGATVGAPLSAWALSRPAVDRLQSDVAGILQRSQQELNHCLELWLSQQGLGIVPGRNSHGGLGRQVSPFPDLESEPSPFLRLAAEADKASAARHSGTHQGLHDAPVLAGDGGVVRDTAEMNLPNSVVEDACTETMIVAAAQDVLAAGLDLDAGEEQVGVQTTTAKAGPSTNATGSNVKSLTRTALAAGVGKTKSLSNAAQDSSKRPLARSAAVEGKKLDALVKESDKSGSSSHTSSWKSAMEKSITSQRKRSTRKRNQVDDFLTHTKRSEAESNKNMMQRIVTGKIFEWSTIFLVLMNAVFLGIEVEVFCSDAANQFLANPGIQVMKKHPGFFKYFSYVFCIFFVAELSLRASAEGLGFFLNSDRLWNIFDLSIVIFSVFEMLMNLAEIDSGLGAVSVLRVLRVIRVIKVLRIIRLLRFFRELRMMLHSLVNSMKSLVWSMLVLILVFYIFGLTFASGTYQGCWVGDVRGVDCGEDPDELRFRFGSVYMSMMSLFMAMSGGIDWGELYLLLRPLGWEYCFIFIVFISFAIFAVVNVVTGVFVESAMQSSMYDREVVISEQLEKKKESLAQMMNLFCEMDSNQSGFIVLEEFENHLDDERAIAYFESMKLDVTEVSTLFTLLDLDQSGQVDIEEFLLGCQRLKGESRSLDVAVIMYELRFLTHTFLCFADFVETQLNIASEERSRTALAGKMDRAKMARNLLLRRASGAPAYNHHASNLARAQSGASTDGEQQTVLASDGSPHADGSVGAALLADPPLAAPTDHIDLDKDDDVLSRSGPALDTMGTDDAAQ